MSSNAASYSKKEIIEALRASGVKKGDIVFSHSNIAYFGFPEEGSSKEAAGQIILDAFREVIGNEGTLIVPTFTYSFCKNLVYDHQQSASTCGFFTEMVRNIPASQRSFDPLFSVTALGDKAGELTENVSRECFGKGSFWERFLHYNGMVCNLNFDAASTFIHYVERCLQVPYRKDRTFSGIAITNGKAQPYNSIFFSRSLEDPGACPDFERFNQMALSRHSAKTVNLGRGAIVSIRAQKTYDLIETELRKDIAFLTVAGKCRKFAV